ncbi:MAG: hypothetical protein AB1657_02510 [Candidatus Micrarchaeota archaeon]
MFDWKGFFLKSAGAALFGVSLLALFLSILGFLLPGIQDSVLQRANDEYAPRMVPILLAHEPQLSTLTYDNTASYCAAKPPGVTMEFGGITDEYVCSLISNNYVGNTEELRLRLARTLISNKVDEMLASYGLQLAGLYSRLPILLALFLLPLFLSFALLYFGSRNLIELAFVLSFLAALFSFLLLLLSALSFFLLPSLMVGTAKERAATQLEIDLITISQDLVSETVGELFLPPIVVFGFLSSVSSLFAVVFYYYLAKLKGS